MAIAFYIPGLLRLQTGGRSQVDIDAAAATVGEALAVLWLEYPGLRDRLVTEQGEVRQHVNIFVGAENIRDCGGFSATVSDGAAITILPAVSGG
jgi:molybdopterin synthase sulfur carrier subunit